ncbi:MAG: integron integrase [Deltaproteobacteria bacterium]|jgi:integron integrase|nr:integron integrase [Deltaproteobacteria bacterium]
MESNRKFRPDPNLKLMDQVRQVLRYHHYAYRTEQAYCDWIVRYIKFHGAKKHPKFMGKPEIDAFLSHLAVNRKIAAATQRQALNAIIFFYKNVLDIEISEKLEPVRAKRRQRLPVVMSQSEVQNVLSTMSGIHQLMAKLLYGGGLRLMECIRLRVQDLDFDQKLIYVRSGKGGKDRTTLFPASIHEDIRIQLKKVKALHDEDLKKGFGEVFLPEALARKYPHAARDYGWQYVFPAKKISMDPRVKIKRRHHVLESGLQKAVKTAVRRVGMSKRVTCHTFRHSFATHLLENGVNIRVVQELMGHADVKTTEIYTHVMAKDIDAVVSPLDAIARLN